MQQIAPLRPDTASRLSGHAPLSLVAFVGIMASLMALNAFAVDIMLPGLPQMAASFGAGSTTEMQKVISFYLMGFGLGQLAMGVLSDRFGRKPVLLAGLVVYVVAALGIAFAGDFTTLLAGRFIMGLGSAAPRVIATAAVRDCYEGRQMARVMSLIMMTFMAVPIIAPALGQLILFVAPWPWIFGTLVVYGSLVTLVCLTALPETLPPEGRRPIALASIAGALAQIAGSRQCLGYMLAAGTFFGALFGFINSAQQVMVEVFGLGVWFPAVFALIAFSLGVSAFANSRLVERLGMRILSHGAVCLFGALSFLMLGLDVAGLLDVVVFVPLMTLIMLLVGLVFSNFNALAMSPMGAIAGIASSVIGSVTTLLGAGIGYLIGQAYDGSVMPLALGFGLSSLATILILLVTERGRLFATGGGR